MAGKCINGYCEIPGWAFQMGSTNGDSDERPVRKIVMTGFQLGQTEVSVGQYRAFLEKASAQLKAILSGCDGAYTSIVVAATLGETEDQLRKRVAETMVNVSCTNMQIVTETPKIPDFPENKKGDQYPIISLTMEEKRAYCQVEGGDLATAAQLHFASQYDEQDSAKGGKDQRITMQNGFKTTEPVTAGYQNRFGVYNLLGNVFESALDAYDPGFYARMPSENPYNPLTKPKILPEDNGQLREYSGGSFDTLNWYARAADRDSGLTWRMSYDGFRCARRLPRQPK